MKNQNTNTNHLWVSMNLLSLFNLDWRLCRIVYQPKIEVKDYAVICPKPGAADCTIIATGNRNVCQNFFVVMENVAMHLKSAVECTTAAEMNAHFRAAENAIADYPFLKNALAKAKEDAHEAHFNKLQPTRRLSIAS